MTKRIRLLTSVAGDGPVTGEAGDELDVEASVAKAWADGERAELIDHSDKRGARDRSVERAVRTPPENASQ